MQSASRRIRALAAALLLVAAGPAAAALAVGDAAPDFTAEAALGGRMFRFALADALRKGPVVLYFYPKAFTRGCTLEANAFAEATPKFAALGATVVGMSNDDIETLKKFSVEACRDRFAVAADAGARVMKQYDAALRIVPGMADRVSYVIGPQGRIVHVHVGMEPLAHVERSLDAVERWQREHGARR
jgi:peroxiredoxin